MVTLFRAKLKDLSSQELGSLVLLGKIREFSRVSFVIHRPSERSFVKRRCERNRGQQAAMIRPLSRAISHFTSPLIPLPFCQLRSASPRQHERPKVTKEQVHALANHFRPSLNLPFSPSVKQNRVRFDFVSPRKRRACGESVSRVDRL